MLLNEKFCKLVYLFGVMLKVNWSHIVLSPVLYLVAKKNQTYCSRCAEKRIANARPNTLRTIFF